MEGWQDLTSISQFDQALQQTATQKLVVFKHSTRCSISSMAQRRLTDLITSEHANVQFLYLDLIAHRDVSNYIADTLQETHQSPQVLIVHNGECIYEASHMEISASEIRKEL